MLWSSPRRLTSSPPCSPLGPGGEAHLARRSTEVVHEQNRIVPPEPTCQMFELRTANARGCKPMILLLARKAAYRVTGPRCISLFTSELDVREYLRCRAMIRSFPLRQGQEGRRKPDQVRSTGNSPSWGSVRLGSVTMNGKLSRQTMRATAPRTVIGYVRIKPKLLDFLSVDGD